MEINVTVDDKFAGCINSNWLESIIERTLREQTLGDEVEVSLVITGQQRMRELNKLYLNENRPTDVLSFALLEPSADAGFITAPDGKKHLGEVIISFPQAVAQAEEHGHSVENEICILTVHGMLHLLGYDHAVAADKMRMQTREKELVILLERDVA